MEVGAGDGFEGMRYAGHRSGGAGRPGLAAPWKVGCAPANVVRGMQMRVAKLAARLGNLAVRQQTLSAACKSASERCLRSLEPPQTYIIP